MEEVSGLPEPALPDGDDIDGHPFNEEDLIPSAKYFELPAGIMLPVIEIEQFAYTALVPDKLRMPPPVPPSQRLLSALDEFYSASLDPTREPPLAAWGRGGCSEFMERKQRLRSILEEKLKSENKTIGDLVENKPTEEELKIEQENINAEIKMKYEEMRRNAINQEKEQQKLRRLLHQPSGKNEGDHGVAGAARLHRRPQDLVHPRLPDPVRRLDIAHGVDLALPEEEEDLVPVLHLLVIDRRLARRGIDLLHLCRLVIVHASVCHLPRSRLVTKAHN